MRGSFFARACFAQRVVQRVRRRRFGAIMHAAATASRIILLYVDIDRFRVVNETRGRAIRDEVLRVVAGCVTDRGGDKGYVAHVAADEFVVVLVDEEGAPDQTEFAEMVRSDIERNVHLVQRRIFLTFSIGVSFFPDNNGSSPQDLRRQSEAAMLRAKRDRRNTVSAFSNEQKQALEDRSTLGLRRAMPCAITSLCCMTSHRFARVTDRSSVSKPWCDGKAVRSDWCHHFGSSASRRTSA